MSYIPEHVSSKYFSGSTFLGKVLAEDIMKKYCFKTTRDNYELFVYKNGIFIPFGKSVIDEESQKLLSVNCSISRINETNGHIKRMNFIDRTEFNKNIELICLKNGVLNILNDELFKHSPEYLLTNQLPIYFDPKADCPNIRKFLSEILEEKDIQVIIELIGYLLLRKQIFQIAFIFVGCGSNGKSVLLNLIKSFVGKENTTSVSLQDLNNKRFAVANCFGKLVNIFPDLSDFGILESSVFKALTGEDDVKAEEKFKKQFEFYNYSKQVFSTNKIPETKDKSDGFFRRWSIIEFPNKFQGKNVDRNLLSKLITKEELSGLLNWALLGLKNLMENNGFSNQLTIAEKRDAYERHASPIYAFVKEMLDEDIETKSTKKEVYQAYKEYCRKHTINIVQCNSFGRKLKKMLDLGDEIRIGTAPAYLGIKLKKDNKEE